MCGLLAFRDSGLWSGTAEDMGATTSEAEGTAKVVRTRNFADSSAPAPLATARGPPTIPPITAPPLRSVFVGFVLPIPCTLN